MRNVKAGIAAFFFAIAIGGAAVWHAPLIAQSSAASPTFNADIAPILYQNCATCHRAGEIAPMSLMSYKEVRPWAKSIKAKVVAREMPPWAADPHYGKFRNERRLTDQQIATLVAWA